MFIPHRELPLILLQKQLSQHVIFTRQVQYVLAQLLTKCSDTQRVPGPQPGFAMISFFMCDFLDIKNGDN